MLDSWPRWLIIGLLVAAFIVCPLGLALSQAVQENLEKQEAQIPVTAAEEFAGCGGNAIPVVNDAYEQKVVELTNQVRAEHGFDPLKRVDELNRSARYHAADMNSDDYFSHETFDRVQGSLAEVCDTWARISHYYTNWTALAENIAAGQRSPEVAMDGWMNSPDHYHNIMSDQYREIGTGYFKGDSTYQHYWVQNFGLNEGRYPLIISGEAERVNDPNVNIFIHGSWYEMRIRVNDGDWSDWQTFSRTLDFDLPGAPGEYTVTAELSNGSSRMLTSDTVILTEPDTGINTLFKTLWLNH
jgi:uncharacterized protein YkwD